MSARPNETWTIERNPGEGMRWVIVAPGETVEQALAIHSTTNDRKYWTRAMARGFILWSAGRKDYSETRAFPGRAVMRRLTRTGEEETMKEAMKKHLQGLGPWTQEEIEAVLARGVWANGNLLDPAEREGLEEMLRDMRKETAGKIYYATSGPVRGSCEHHHRTREAAAKCAARDQSGCESQGGYSDRDVIRVENGVSERLIQAGENGEWARECEMEETFTVDVNDDDMFRK